MLILQLVTFLLVLSLIKSLIPVRSRPFSFLLSFLFAIVFVVQLSSVIITGDIADYRFYENFNLGDVLSVADFFGKEGLLIVLALITSTFLIHYLGRFLGKITPRKSIYFVSLMVGIIILCISGGIINNAYTTVRLKFAGNASFDEALASLEIPRGQYTSKEEIKASKGKNIIVLSLESMEKGYLGEKLKHLTPNLSKLAKEQTFYRMNQSPAGGWTSASMYTAITGVPAFFGAHGNEVFQKSYEHKLTSLSDVLKSAGYDLQYFIGKKEFSGIDDMLKTLGFTVKSEKDFDTKYPNVNWGIQDLDLFTEFKKELLLKKDSEQPFALFLSTISTHFPNGVPDKRMDSLLPPQKSRLELMASATDLLIGDLITFLDKEGMLSNTVFYIYPDHLLMGNKSRVLEDFDERSLYLLTNATPNSLSYPSNEAIFQIDIPKIILEGAGIVHNAKFLTDFIPDKDKNVYLAKNDKNLLRLNDAALKVLNCKEGIYISLNTEAQVFEIRNEEDVLVFSSEMPDKGSCQRILFDENYRPVSNFPIDAQQLTNKPKAFAYLDIFSTNGLLHGSLKERYGLGITKNGVDKIVFEKEDLALLDHIKLEEDKQNSIIVKSSSWHAKKSSSFSIKSEEKKVSRGLTLICFNAKSGYEFRTFDTYGSPEDAQAFVDLLKRILEDQVKYIILAHDSAAKSLTPFSEVLFKLGFKKLSQLQSREAYIGYNLGGVEMELVDHADLKIAVDFPVNITNETLYFSEPKPGFKNNVDRYIAHAGGMIDGVKYTNTKEALDYNYAQGFRLFELDIIETVEGEYVAAHDWNHWAAETKFEGTTPVSLATFRKYRIRDKYTTLDMKAINTWFAEHSDAILVTDKVNTPKKFGAKFIDKTRLKMELFSLPAIEEAVANGVEPLLSENLLSNTDGDIISYLKANNVSQIAMSRRSIANRKALLKRFRDNHIKVYVYQVNFDQGKDEQFVFDNELGWVYGMYADQWIPAFVPSR